METNQTLALSALDQYNILAFGTPIENVPYFLVRLDEAVAEERLRNAVEGTLRGWPRFQTRLCLGKTPGLEANRQPVLLHHTSAEQRPLELEKANNGYLWQICYEGDTISFEWCHALTDGRGALRFFSAILERYYGAEAPCQPEETGAGADRLPTPEGAPLPEKEQPKGYRLRDFPSEPHPKRHFRCHGIKMPTGDVLAVSHRADSTPAAVLVPLFSRAVRRYLPTAAKNRTVCSSVVIDARTPTRTETIHNFILTRQLSYVDRYDDMEFALVSTIYRSLLDVTVQPENAASHAAELVHGIQALLGIRPAAIRKLLFRQIATLLKKTQCNFAFTYLGRVPVSEETAGHLLDFQFRSWADFGQANLAVIDLNGTMHINICEEYKDQRVIDAFAENCRSVGIAVQEPVTFWQSEACNRF